METSAKTEKKVRYLRINDKIQRLSGSVGKLERFVRDIRGDEEISKDGTEPEASSFQDIYSAIEERLDTIKDRISKVTAILRELIEGVANENKSQFDEEVRIARGLKDGKD